MIRIHALLWLGSFFLWYLLYVSSFCALIFPYGTLSLFGYLIVWKVIWSLTICSLLSAALTAPARIPKEFIPPDGFVEKHSRSLLQAIARWARSQKLCVRFRKMATDLGMTKAPNYCYICRLIKPDRAHHCRRCGRCILRMDHHCPVLGECIHMHNHKFFMLFLFWASILCVFAAIAVMPTVIFRSVAIYWRGDYTRMVPTILVSSGAINALVFWFPYLLAQNAEYSSDAYVMWSTNSAPFAVRNRGAIVLCKSANILLPTVCGIALICFLRELVLALLRNETTLEGIARHEYGEEDAFDDGIAHYDLGSKLANFKSVFGADPRLWLLPIPTTYGNGYKFKYFVSNLGVSKKKYKSSIGK